MAGNVHSASLDFPKTCSLHGALILHWPSTTAALLQQLFVVQTTVLRVGVSVLEIQKRPPSRGQGVPQTCMETTPPTNSGLSCSIRWIVEEFLGKAAVFLDLLGNGAWKKLQKYSPKVVKNGDEAHGKKQTNGCFGCLMVIYHGKKQKITFNKHKLWDRFHEEKNSILRYLWDAQASFCVVELYCFHLENVDVFLLSWMYPKKFKDTLTCSPFLAVTVTINTNLYFPTVTARGSIPTYIFLILMTNVSLRLSRSALVWLFPTQTCQAL